MTSNMILTLTLLSSFVPIGIYSTILYYTGKLQFFWLQRPEKFCWYYNRSDPDFTLRWMLIFKQFKIKRINYEISDS